jgi:ABC-type sugar transport system substrate-binding protein
MKKIYGSLVFLALVLLAAAFTAVAVARPTAPVKPPKLTIGIIPSTAQSENLGVWIAQFKAVGARFGAKIVVCDGAGDVTKMEGCGQGFVTQKVSAIVTMALGGPEIPTTFKQAKAAKIPVLAFGTTVTPGFEKNYNGIFADNIVRMGAATAKWIAKNRKDIPIVGEEITQNYGGQGYINGLKAQLVKEGLKFADLVDTDLANIVNSMTTVAETIMQRNPGKLTFIDFSDFGASLYEPVFSRGGRAKDITIITRYSNPTSVKQMRAGANLLVQDSAEWEHVFDLFDALLANKTSGKAWPKSNKTVYEPRASVFAIGDFPKGVDRPFPFAPGLKKQEAEWKKTWILKKSSLTAP